MGMLFNSPDTLQIVNVLNRHYDDGPNGLARARARNDVAVYMDFGTYRTLSAVADQLQLLPGNDRGNRRWRWFLDYIDGLPGPTGLNTIGVELRNAIAAACNNNPVGCTSIEFFAVPDANVSLHLGNVGNNDGTYSRIITIFTNLIDRYGAPQ